MVSLCGLNGHAREIRHLFIFFYQTFPSQQPSLGGICWKMTRMWWIKGFYVWHSWKTTKNISSIISKEKNCSVTFKKIVASICYIHFLLSIFLMSCYSIFALKKLIMGVGFCSVLQILYCYFLFSSWTIPDLQWWLLCPPTCWRAIDQLQLSFFPNAEGKKCWATGSSRCRNEGDHLHIHIFSHTRSKPFYSLEG